MILDVTDLHSGTQRKITIKYVKQVQFGDFQYTQVLNIIVRKVMAMLDLQLVGRNFYDPAAMVTFIFLSDSISSIYINIY